MVQVTHARVRRYSVAVLAVAIALLVKLLLDPLNKIESPFIIFLPSVIVSAWYGGWDSGILATAIAALANYLLLFEIYSQQGTSLGQNLQLGLFVLETVLISWLISALNSAKRQAEVRALELRESEPRFRQITENIREVVWLSEPDANQMLYVSPMYEEIWGRSCESLYNQSTSFLDGIHPEDRDRVIAGQDKQVRGDYDREYRVVRPDGSVRWVRSRVFPIRDRTGQVYRLTGIVEDITEPKRVEAELLHSEERFRTSVENMLDCFGIYSAVRDGSGQILDFKVEYVNAAACTNNLMTKEEQMGKGLCELLPAHRKTGLFDEYCRVVETGTPLIKESLSYEDDYGQQHLNRAFDIRATKLGDGFVATWRDISDRKRTEEEVVKLNKELQRLLAESQTLLEVIPIGIGIASDPECKRIRVNPCFAGQLGISPDANASLSAPSEERPTNYKIYRDGRELSRQELTMQYAAANGVEVLDVEVDVVRADGKVVKLLEYAAPLFDEHGKPRGCVAAFADITERKRVEEELRRREQEFKAIVENSPEIIARIDREFRHVYVNPVIEQVTGMSPQTFLGKTHRELGFPEEICVRWHEYMERVFATGQEQHMEFDFLTPKGKNYYTSRLVPEFGKDGSVESLLGITYNITERKLASEELKQQKEILQTILDNIPVMVDFHDDAGNCVYVNAEWKRVYGWSLEMLKSRGSEELFAAILPEREDRQQVYDYMAEKSEGWRDFKVVIGDGRVQEQCWANVVLSNGMKIGIGIDITSRKQAEDALRESEERFRKFFASAPIGISVVDLDGRFLEVNKAYCEMLGYTQQELSKLTFADITHPEDASKDLQQAEQLFKGEIPSYQLEKRYIKKNGEILWVNLTGTMICAGGGKSAMGWVWRKTSPRASRQKQRCGKAKRGLGVFLIPI